MAFKEVSQITKSSRQDTPLVQTLEAWSCGVVMPCILAFWTYLTGTAGKQDAF